MKPLPVHAWPGDAPAKTGAWPDGVFVISVATSPDRAVARAQLRQALTDALAAFLGMPAHAIGIDATPGAAPTAWAALADGRRRIRCSFAHDDGLSLAAVNLHGAVGIDLMRVQDIDDWQAVARDYLGPSVTQTIANTAPAQRPQAFARAWTAREAQLKREGTALHEWGEGSGASGVSLELDLPAGWVGTLNLDV